MQFSLEKSKGFFLSPTVFVAISLTGQVYAFNFQSDSANYITNIEVSKCEDFIPAINLLHLQSIKALVHGSISELGLYSCHAKILSDAQIKFQENVIFFIKSAGFNIFCNYY